jgi:hypothetical protein
MQILSFGCARYKPFREPVHVELRPLTLVLGRNNSGKTALVRLPRLLLEALAPPTPRGVFPLEAAGLQFGRTFRDLIHGRQPSGKVEFEIACQEGAERLDLRATVQDIQGALEPPSVVSRLEWRAAQSRLLEWKPTPEAIAAYKNYGPIPFRGLLPDAPDWEFVDAWRMRARRLQEAMAHLGPLRDVARPIYNDRGRRALTHTGSEAPGWLVHDPELMPSVGAWFEENMQGWRLRTERTLDSFSCVMTRAGIDVNLCDAGQGAQQILPVVVQQLAHRNAASEFFMDIVEQPELHLHAAAEGPIADLFVETARSGAGVVLVETHSENFLLRVRRRIAEGVLDPERVAVYWVDDSDGHGATVRKIQVDAGGEVDFWPEGVFSEAYEEVKAIRRAARAKGALA